MQAKILSAIHDDQTMKRSNRGKTVVADFPNSRDPNADPAENINIHHAAIQIQGE